MKPLLFNAAVFYEKLMNREVRAAHKLLEKGNQATREELLKLKTETFRALVQFIYDQNPYYKNLFVTCGYTPNDFQTLGDLKKLPFLTKTQIKSNRDSLNTASIDDAECITRTSGGTTGEPIHIVVNKQARINELYFYYRGLNWMGWTPGQSMIKFFGGSLGGNNSPTLKNKIKKWVSGELFLPAFELDKKNAPSYLETIKKRGKTFLQGYVSSIYNLAIYAKELNFKGLQIQGAFTTAEQLPPEQADFISEVFNCEVKGFYGCAEINCLGFQTEMHGPYIIPEEIVHFEQVTHPETGIPNSFLITSLYNYKTPLLRYLNGDNGILGNAHSKYQTIDELHGRSADLFIKPDGSYVSSILATQTMQITGLTDKIKRYQLVQDDTDHITFYYQPFEAPLSKEEVTKILSMYQQRLGTELTIEPQLTDGFITSSSGKHRLMINKLAHK